jgi:electron transfer flavoprotein alpha subunit
MGGVAVFVESGPEGMKSSALPAVTAARELARHHAGAGAGCPVIAVLIGADTGTAASQAAVYVDRVLRLDAPALGPVLAETYAPALAGAVRQIGASALVASSTSAGKDILPRVAALLEAGMASDVSRVLGPRSFRRPTYAGNALCDVEVLTPIVLASVRQTEFPPAGPGASPGAIESGTAPAPSSLGAELCAIHATKSVRPELTEAKVVVSGGRGMKSGENFHILEELTDLLGGALGASRAAADAGMVPNDLQVGQTGKVVAPNLYIAVAISGAIQHLAGMKGSKVIVAINKDPEAPIFQVADYGLVANWETAVPTLIAEIKKIKGRG